MSCRGALPDASGAALQVHWAQLCSRRSCLLMAVLPPVTRRARIPRHRRAAHLTQGTERAEAAPSPGSTRPALPGTH